jgi:hypothetical protein
LAVFLFARRYASKVYVPMAKQIIKQESFDISCDTFK